MTRGTGGLGLALLQWQDAAGPYWPYVAAAPFLGDPPAAASEPGRVRPRRVSPPLGDALRAIGGEVGLALFVDLPPTRTLPATALLNDLGFIVVPIIERWVASPAVVRCDTLARDLAAYGCAVVCPSRPRGVVFLLDGERAGPGGPLGSRTAKRLDNRYRYSTHRFPPPSFLQRQEIRAVHWLPNRGIAPDLQPYFDCLLGSGFPVELVPGPLG